jgi:DNA-binding transcriptional MerR regulator
MNKKDLVAALFEQGTSIEEIQALYEQKTKEQEKEKRVGKAREALIQATADYIEAIAPDVSVSASEIENEILNMERKLAKVKSLTSDEDAILEFAKRMGW